ncbi:carbon-nitrogen hydrolase family protein [Streptomyces halobius]|uniref:Carbon-nitrogen hydrolase n=1 Tax=Streptomyces halobius TaxID=2879846 RepID=A0ABY4MCZ4_9ACTN|nr:hypothetical protein [Streptomyces halobius]UQA95550.1 hypothetical protein K9S39_30140 [Streptomyces halobius]
MIIAAAQFTPVPRDIDANAARMAALVTEAAGRGAGPVVFAELALSRYDVAAIAADPQEMAVTPEDARLAPRVRSTPCTDRRSSVRRGLTGLTVAGK